MLLKNFGKCYTINVPKLEKKRIKGKEGLRLLTLNFSSKTIPN